jgi:NADH dehydrogenase [ubiquinone] 1 alpha subcomplex assembly factor 7
MPLIVAHEFFDALPIHTFQSVVVPPTPKEDKPASSSSSETSEQPQSVTIRAGHPARSAKSQSPLQWREMVVTPTPPGSTHESLGTPRSQRPQHAGASNDTSPVPDFQLTLASGETRHSHYLPAMSPRYQAVLQGVPQGGAIIEVCPDAALYATEFAARIGGTPENPKSKATGAALILDYGPGDGSIPVNSLRGIRQHQMVSPFAEPGLTDLSADVDFEAIAEVATMASEGVEVHGPVDQADFLLSMGIRERAKALAKTISKDSNECDKAMEAAAVAADIERSWQRLVDRGPNGMGKVYKALAILPENSGRRRPVGFGGDVVQ